MFAEHPYDAVGHGKVSSVFLTPSCVMRGDIFGIAQQIAELYCLFCRHNLIWHQDRSKGRIVEYGITLSLPHFRYLLRFLLAFLYILLVAHGEPEEFEFFSP